MQAGRDLALAGPDRRHAERGRDVLLLGHLADERALAGPRGGQSERGGDRRLADAALAGDDSEPFVEQVRTHGT